MTHTFILKDVKKKFFYYENPKLLSAEYVVTFHILNAKFFIHKQKWLKSPVFPPFSCWMGLSFHLLDLQITKRVPNFWCIMTTFLKGCNFIYIYIDNTIIWCTQIQNICFLFLFLWLLFVGIYSCLASLILYVSTSFAIYKKKTPKWLSEWFKWFVY